MWIIASVIFFLLLLMLVKFTFEVNVNTVIDNKKLKLKAINGMPNCYRIKLLGITVYKKEIFKENSNKKNKSKKWEKLNIKIKDIMKIIKCKKLLFVLGFNTDDYIINSQLNAVVNATICIFINSYQNVFDLKNIYYSTYISDRLFSLNFECIFETTIGDTISVLLKKIYKYLREKRESKIFERRNTYVRSSNRKFNGNSNELT